MTNFAYTLYLYAANMHFTTRHLAFLARSFETYMSLSFAM